MKRFILFLSIAMWISLSNVSVFAQIPRTISFQGVLADAQGNLVPDGNHQLSLILYDAAINGNQLFTETQTVPVVKGIFNVIIGSVNPLPVSLTFERAYFLSVSVDGGQELIPRTALTSVPYALRAERANIAESLSPNATGVVTKINGQDGEIELQGDGATTVSTNGNRIKISSTGGGSAGVSSVNNLTGALTLTGSGGTTVNANGNTLTITAPGGGGTGIQGVQNGNNTLDVLNPNGPTATIDVKNQGITTTQLADGAVTSAKIQDGQVRTADLEDGGVSTAKLADDAVTSAKIKDGQVREIDLGIGAVSTTKLADDAVTSVKIQDGQVRTADLADGAVTNVKIADNTVTGAKIQDGQIYTADLADGLIITSKLADNAVTSSKIAGGQVVKSINSLKDNVTIAAGSNVTITPSGSTLTIASSGGGLTLPFLSSITNTLGAFMVNNMGTGLGLYGFSAGSYGVQGESTSKYGVYGTSTSSNGVHGNSSSGIGVYGSSSSNHGIYGSSSANDPSSLKAGVYGIAQNGYGVYGKGEFGVCAYGGVALTATASGNGFAGQFTGDVEINGHLSKSSGSFKIDHPLDPQNKYLYHSFVESPDMMNIYNGIATLNTDGEAVVQLPSYFQTLNSDYRYQLTCIGGYAPVYISEKISGNQFKIGGGKSGMEISWEVTGIRQDVYAKAHRIIPEVEKPGKERGTYLHPKEHGAPETMGIYYERNKQMDEENARMKALEEKLRTERKK